MITRAMHRLRECSRAGMTVALLSVPSAMFGQPLREPLGARGSWMADLTGSGLRVVGGSRTSQVRENSGSGTLRIERFVLKRVSLGLQFGVNAEVNHYDMWDLPPSIPNTFPERERILGVTLGPVASVFVPLGASWFATPLARLLFTQQDRSSRIPTETRVRVEQRREAQFGIGLGRRIGGGAVVGELRRHAFSRHETWSDLTFPTEWTWRGSLAVRVFFP